MKCRAEANRFAHPQLHVSSREHPEGSPSPGATCRTRCPWVLWAPRGDAGWSVLAPRQLKPLSPHLHKSSLFSHAFPILWQFTFCRSHPLCVCWRVQVIILPLALHLTLLEMRRGWCAGGSERERCRFAPCIFSQVFGLIYLWEPAQIHPNNHLKWIS